MRSLAGLAIVLTCGLATNAAAQAGLAQPTHDSLTRAAFAPGAEADVLDRMLERDQFLDGAAVRWSSSEIRLSDAAHGGAVDSLRVSVAGALATPGALALRPDLAEFDARAYDVTLIRSWPGAVSFGGKKFAVDVSPHAGLGVGNRGGSAEAGAEVRLAPKTREERAVEQLKDMGVGDGAVFGDRGRWYLFAAASGRAVGLNMLRNDTGWDRAGWTTDATSELVGDAHVGVGWRKGSVQTSFGVVHREVRGENMIFGQKTQDDTVAAFSFSIRPGR
jgi:hypothetical protein